MCDIHPLNPVSLALIQPGTALVLHRAGAASSPSSACYTSFISQRFPCSFFSCLRSRSANFETFSQLARLSSIYGMMFAGAICPRLTSRFRLSSAHLSQLKKVWWTSSFAIDANFGSALLCTIFKYA